MIEHQPDTDNPNRHTAPALLARYAAPSIRHRILGMESTTETELRIDVARSRHIILAERSASASLFGVCSGSCPLRAANPCNVRCPDYCLNGVTAVGIAHW